MKIISQHMMAHGFEKIKTHYIAYSSANICISVKNINF